MQYLKSNLKHKINKCINMSAKRNQNDLVFLELGLFFPCFKQRLTCIFLLGKQTFISYAILLLKCFDLRKFRYLYRVRNFFLLFI